LTYTASIKNDLIIAAVKLLLRFLGLSDALRSLLDLSQHCFAIKIA
jgi:hypothetical protein